ncbi:hypothetical protein [Collibacillus ludicampi]|uniref:hypothetical protein n=1 Tax=Collibacillus ludicampi TaxID=2771369 RepID=UPI002495022A|nr:hypothetical protein [Collibacillus ludicampi]
MNKIVIGLATEENEQVRDRITPNRITWISFLYTYGCLGVREWGLIHGIIDAPVSDLLHI